MILLLMHTLISTLFSIHPLTWLNLSLIVLVMTSPPFVTLIPLSAQYG